MDLNKILNNLSSNSSAKGFLGGLAGGAVSGTLTSKKGRKNAAKLVKAGGLAAVGVMAWKAYQQYSGSKQNPSTSTATSPSTSNAKPGQNWNNLGAQAFHNLDDTNSDQSQSIFVLKCMVAAAMSDGHIDSSEYQNILSKADDLGLSGEDKNLVFSEISNPMSLDTVIRQSNTPELAMEVYTASLLAIDEDLPQGRDYLQRLANGLQLPPPLVNAVHQQIANS
ncbi:MAG: tellurite resistance TerB family protein [Kangiellaceae bacterium]|nr:tellurite resistance TerB family protein [Kangiellaceae bacterium]MCW8997575.1 tellurite resistance TerB family protein [Kangiellaceae bacterium]